MESKVEDQQPFLGFRDDPNRRSSTDESEAEHGSPRCKQAPKPPHWRRLTRDVVVCLATSLLWAAALFLLAPNPFSSSSSNMAEGSHRDSHGSKSSDYIAAFHNVTSNAEYISCGNSTAEAKGKGCKYHTLLNYWVPAQCFDQEFETEYQDDDSWTAFADQDLTERIAPEAMGEQEVYYTSIRDHLNHCSMLWKKQFWTLFEERTAFDGVVVSSFHTEHCADFLKDIYGSNRTEPTLVRVGFSGCWIRKNSRYLI